jgi:hypothetical protein
MYCCLGAFPNRDLGDHWAPLLGTTVLSLTHGQLSYYLRRFWLYVWLAGIPGTHRRGVTDSRWLSTLVLHAHH